MIFRLYVHVDTNELHSFSEQARDQKKLIPSERAPSSQQVLQLSVALAFKDLYTYAQAIAPSAL